MRSLSRRWYLKNWNAFFYLIFMCLAMYVKANDTIVRHWKLNIKGKASMMSSIWRSRRRWNSSKMCPHTPEDCDTLRCRTFLYPPGTAVHRAVRRWGTANQAGDGAEQAWNRQDDLYSGRTDYGTSFCRCTPSDWDIKTFVGWWKYRGCHWA